MNAINQIARTRLLDINDYNNRLQQQLASWTPVLTFSTTPGDLSVSYTTQVGTVSKIGNVVRATFGIVTSAFTFTTASGDLTISGLPYVNNADGVINETSIGGLIWSGITKAGYTDISTQINQGNSVLLFTASASGVDRSVVTAADMPTGGSVVLRGSVEYLT